MVKELFKVNARSLVYSQAILRVGTGLHGCPVPLPWPARPCSAQALLASFAHTPFKNERKYYHLFEEITYLANINFANLGTYICLLIVYSIKLYSC